MSSNERRSQVRLRTEPQPSVPILTPDQGSGTGSVVDISGSGLRIRSGAFFPQGSRLRVGIGPLLIIGEVRYCQRSSDTLFDAGLRILSAQTLDPPADFVEYLPPAPSQPGGEG